MQARSMLETLPAEVLYMIGEHLSPQELMALGKASKTLMAIIFPNVFTEALQHWILALRHKGPGKDQLDQFKKSLTMAEKMKREKILDDTHFKQVTFALFFYVEKFPGLNPSAEEFHYLLEIMGAISDGKLKIGMTLTLVEHLDAHSDDVQRGICFEKLYGFGMTLGNETAKVTAALITKLSLLQPQEKTNTAFKAFFTYAEKELEHAPNQVEVFLALSISLHCLQSVQERADYNNVISNKWLTIRSPDNIPSRRKIYAALGGVRSIFFTEEKEDFLKKIETFIEYSDNEDEKIQLITILFDTTFTSLDLLEEKIQISKYCIWLAKEKLRSETSQAKVFAAVFSKLGHYRQIETVKYFKSLFEIAKTKLKREPDQALVFAVLASKPCLSSGEEYFSWFDKFFSIAQGFKSEEATVQLVLSLIQGFELVLKTENAVDDAIELQTCIRFNELVNLAENIQDLMARARLASALVRLVLTLLHRSFEHTLTRNFFWEKKNEIGRTSRFDFLFEMAKDVQWQGHDYRLIFFRYLASGLAKLSHENERNFYFKKIFVLVPGLQSGRKKIQEILVHLVENFDALSKDPKKPQFLEEILTLIFEGTKDIRKIAVASSLIRQFSLLPTDQARIEWFDKFFKLLKRSILIIERPIYLEKKEKVFHALFQLLSMLPQQDKAGRFEHLIGLIPEIGEEITRMRWVSHALQNLDQFPMSPERIDHFDALLEHIQEITEIEIDSVTLQLFTEDLTRIFRRLTDEDERAQLLLRLCRRLPALSSHLHLHLRLFVEDMLPIITAMTDGDQKREVVDAMRDGLESYPYSDARNSFLHALAEISSSLHAEVEMA